MNTARSKMSIDSSQAIKEKDISIAINMDLKIFTQRFFEFVNQTTNYSELHNYVHMLMQSDAINNFENKVLLISNLL